MAWIRMSGGGEKVKEFGFGTYYSAVIQKDSESMIADLLNFTVHHKGKMILDFVISQSPGTQFSYTIKLKKNGNDVHSGVYNKTGRWFYHYEIDVNDGDVFTQTGSGEGMTKPNANCCIYSLTYKII